MSARYVVVEETGLAKANVIVGGSDDRQAASGILESKAIGSPGKAFILYMALTESTYTPPKPSQGTLSTKTFGASA